MNIAIILANGVGSRIHSSIPKQYIEVEGKPILAYTIEAFQKNKNIDKIMVVANPIYHQQILSIASKYHFTKLTKVIEGGETRQKSSFKAITSLKEENVKEEDIVLIHDACRPLISQDIINNNIEACKMYSYIDTVIPVTNTILYTGDQKCISQSLNRNNLVASQTPQTFIYKNILKVHLNNQSKEVTDDCQLALLDNNKVYMVQGSPLNFKITTDLDLELFKQIIAKKNK